MNAPPKPFDTYAWKWLSFAPTENLLKVPVFLGVLRALARHEGERKNSDVLQQELRALEGDLDNFLVNDFGGRITLARDGHRNLFRNSGQYWTGTGLLAKTQGLIELTQLGRRVASSQITNDEFAALMVRNTVLPNPQTYSDAELGKWREAGLRIKPFELILSIMDKLGRSSGLLQAYLTPNELIKIVIPLAGARASLDEITQAIASYRNGELDISDFPDCAPAANDKRLAREFLLFLENFGICQGDENTSRYEQRFTIDEVFSLAIAPDEQVSFLEDSGRTDDEVDTLRDSEIPIFIDRRRVAMSVIRRTNQSRFRKDVLRAAQNRCVLTQEVTSDVIEAAHIIPVGHGGTDAVGNGLCMRVDIHRLFDNGKIRIAPDGAVTLNEQIAEAISYRDLPQNINFPTNVGLENIEWRFKYL